MHGQRPAAAEQPAALPAGSGPITLQHAALCVVLCCVVTALVVLLCNQGMGGRRAALRETRAFNSRRYVASFDVDNTTKGDSGRYRCIGQSERGVGVSSYAELTVKRKCVCVCRGAGETLIKLLSSLAAGL